MQRSNNRDSDQLREVSIETDINIKRPIAVIPVGKESENEALIITEKLRKNGFYVDLGYSGNLKKQIVAAKKYGLSLKKYQSLTQIEKTSLKDKYSRKQKIKSGMLL